MLDTLPILPDDEVRRIALDDPDAGFGTLRTARGSLPLDELSVEARLDGLVCGIELRQVFINTHDEHLEATYIFPLPDRSAVTRFRLEVAGRVIEGELQERSKARKTYDQAIQTGHRAAIAEEERPGVFTLRVGNLPPGERATVHLTLVGPLPVRDDEVTFRFPLVVAPRYIPGSPLPRSSVGTGTATDTDAVPDASRISPPVLLPGFPSPVRLSLSVSVPESPLAPHDFCSSLHTVVEQQGMEGRRFVVRPGERLDRDFIFRYRLGTDRVHTGLVVRPDENGNEGTFLLTLLPPRGKPDAQARGVIFVLDRSGSMSGWKMVAARRAVARMVETLTEDDRFSIYAFDDDIETPPGCDGQALVPGSDRQRFRAEEFLASIDARGGTEMARPLEQAVATLEREAGTGNRILVLITDGQVGNEDQILRQLGPRLKNIRVFTLGIDRAVNAAFLRRLADLGGGACELVESENRLEQVMDQVHRSIGTPVLTGLELRPAGLDLIADTVVPARLPDLFSGTPVLISGRYRGKPEGAIRVSARDSVGQDWSTEVQAWKTTETPIGPIWARGRVRDLEDRYVLATSARSQDDRAKLEHEIVETSLRNGVLSRFTAFVAVDRAEIVNPGGEQKQMTQPVEQPAGWGLVDTMSAQPGAGAMPASCAPQAAFDDMDCMLRGPVPPVLYLRIARGGGDTAPKAKSAFALDGEAAESKGLLSRLFSAVFGGSSEVRQTPTDRRDFRSLVEELRRRLTEGVGPDVGARLAALRQVGSDLTRLVQQLAQIGDVDPTTQRLQQLAKDVVSLLAQTLPSEEAVQQHYAELLAALDDWLKGIPPSGGPAAGQEAFWK